MFNIGADMTLRSREIDSTPCWAHLALSQLDVSASDLSWRAIERDTLLAATSGKPFWHRARAGGPGRYSRGMRQRGQAIRLAQA